MRTDGCCVDKTGTAVVSTVGMLVERLTAGTRVPACKPPEDAPSGPGPFSPPAPPPPVPLPARLPDPWLSAPGGMLGSTAGVIGLLVGAALGSTTGSCAAGTTCTTRYHSDHAGIIS